MPSSLRPFSDLGAALRLLRETVAGLTQVQVAERDRVLLGREFFAKLFGCHGVPPC